MNERSEKVIKLVVCIAIIITVIIFKIFDSMNKKDEGNPTYIEMHESMKNNVNDITSPKNEEKESNNDDVSMEENNSNSIENSMIEAQENYVDDAGDGINKYVYFENGDVLYNNTDIPLGVYSNQMDSIQSFVDLNYEEQITKLKILEDSVVIEDKKLMYTCDMYNDRFLYVTCDLNTFEFSFADSKK